MNMNVRLSEEQSQEIKAKAKANGFENMSAYVKYVALNATVVATVPKPSKEDKK